MGMLFQFGALFTDVSVFDNARIVDGEMVTEGSQVALGDTDQRRAAQVRYEVLCRRHHRLRQTAAKGRVDPSPDPLPFEPGAGPS